MQESELQENLQTTFVQTLEQYNKVANNKTCEGGCSDPWGKKFFHNTWVVLLNYCTICNCLSTNTIPRYRPVDVEGPFIAGVVTPVLHYTMVRVVYLKDKWDKETQYYLVMWTKMQGGLGISTEGHLLRTDGNPIHGVFAAGEVFC